MTAPLAVTVLTGSPGTDGSRIVERLLRSALRITAIVPRGSRTLAASAPEASVLPTTERLVRLGKGCTCCTVRGDLMEKLRRIATEQTAAHVVIQATPHSDLVILAKTFTVADSSGAVLSEVAHLESLVVVLDAREVLTLQSARSLIERIDLADVIVVEGADILAPAACARVASTLTALNPAARVVWAEADDLGLAALRGPRSFDLKTAQSRASLDSVLSGRLTTSADVTRFVYRAIRPFHPARLHALLQEPWEGVLRARGTFWVASFPHISAILDVVGDSRGTAADGLWWDAVPKERHPDSADFRAHVATWDPLFGDRHQELAIVGIDVDEASLRSRLDTCLITNQELATPERWRTMPHPFAWPEASA